MYHQWNVGVCEVCNAKTTVAVCSLPGIPMTIARCGGCYDADVIPLWIAVGNTALMGGMWNCADWWHEIVTDTLAYLGVNSADFTAMVEQRMLADDAPASR